MTDNERCKAIGQIIRDMDAGRIDASEAYARMRALPPEPWLDRFLYWIAA